MFTISKSRVAPLKRLTIPRLELQGAVLASRLCKTIVEESRFKFDKVVLFLDSKIVLAWMRSEARKFKTFVSVRVGEIQSNTNPAQWKYVPGELNVADDVSHGIAAQSLVERWQHGPKFLRLPENEWLQDSATVHQPEVEEECRKVHHVCIKWRSDFYARVSAALAFRLIIFASFSSSSVFVSLSSGTQVEEKSNFVFR